MDLVANNTFSTALCNANEQIDGWKSWICQWILMSNINMFTECHRNICHISKARIKYIILNSYWLLKSQLLQLSVSLTVCSLRSRQWIEIDPNISIKIRFVILMKMSGNSICVSVNFNGYGLFTATSSILFAACWFDIYK